MLALIRSSFTRNLKAREAFVKVLHTYREPYQQCDSRGDDWNRLKQVKRGVDFWYADVSARKPADPRQLLRNICDLQIVTGLGIIIASLVQGDDMEYYHQDQALGYWYLTLISFWAVDPIYLDPEGGDYPRTPLIARRFLLLCSCIFSAIFQFKLIAEHYQGAPPDKGCYRSVYGNQWIISDWLFAIGNILYALGLLSDLIAALRHRRAASLFH
jgi:hypothetical protein